VDGYFLLISPSIVDHVLVYFRVRVIIPLNQLVQSLLDAIAVLGESNVNSPFIKVDRIDSAAGLNGKIDRVGKFVLAAVGRLHEVTGVEDRRG